jgi:thioredoxin-dependent peroxiredoxin
MANLKTGDPAPDFSGVLQDGRKISLKDFRGHKLILYFYPKDDTPGCTAEACNLKDNYDLLLRQGYRILGVSADSESAHKKFIAKYVLPFDLLADIDKKIIRDYSVWGQKNLYGKISEGILRTTFIISGDGIIEHIITKVDTKNHAGQILKELTIDNG